MMTIKKNEKIIKELIKGINFKVRLCYVGDFEYKESLDSNLFLYTIRDTTNGFYFDYNVLFESVEELQKGNAMIELYDYDSTRYYKQDDKALKALSYLYDDDRDLFNGLSLYQEFIGKQFKDELIKKAQRQVLRELKK